MHLLAAPRKARDRSSTVFPSDLILRVATRKVNQPGEKIAAHSNRGVAVGTAISDRPPHRSVRAELPHTAPV